MMATVSSGWEATTWRQGRLPLDRFVTERITLTEVDKAFEAMRTGRVLRSVVVL